jgi:metal-sulfur cluster biosynthetic enzyme
MTLTTPACPVAGSLPGEVEQRLRSTTGITDAKVELTWEPPWDYHDLSDEIKLQLGLL